MTSATVFNIQRFSLHDGPGIRTTVFLKGCPLSCPWCHNPESLDSRPQPLLAGARCVHCHRCAAVCEAQVAGPQEPGRAENREACTWCGACAQVCPAGAREMVGEQMTASQVVEQALRDRPYFQASGGGVTFSGGEPLFGASAPLVLECLALLRDAGVHTAVDTCGLVSRDVLEEAADLADLILFDLKLADTDRHRAVTGAGNEAILANLQALLRRGANVRISVPLVPGHTDDEANLRDLADILLNLAERKAPPAVRLLPYHPTAGGKYSRLGLAEPLAGVPAPSPEHVARCATLLQNRGLHVTTGGQT